MVAPLQQAVGKDCPNLYPDVKLVTDLLNAVPPIQGGPKSPVSAPDIANTPGAPEGLIAALGDFQQKQFWKRLKRVNPDSATFYRLLSYQNKGPIIGAPNGHRVKIGWCAGIMAAANPISDQGLVVAKDKRKGGDVLRRIFEESVENPPNFADPAKYPYQKDDEHRYKITNLDGVQVAGMRISQDATGLGINWCGIFANWIWQMATEMNFKWRLGQGPVIGGKVIKPSTKLEALAPGDIAIRKEKNPKKKLVHHFVVCAMSPDGKEIQTVDGNAGDYQQILFRKYSIDDIQYFYSFDTALRLADAY